jgi:hypothetical protein
MRDINNDDVDESNSKLTNKKGFKPIRFNEDDINFQNKELNGMDCDATGYPLLPDGDVIYICRNISENENFRNHYSKWAWKVSKSRGKNKKHEQKTPILTLTKSCLGVNKCSNVNCKAQAYRPTQHPKRKSKRDQM